MGRKYYAYDFVLAPLTLFWFVTFLRSTTMYPAAVRFADLNTWL